MGELQKINNELEEVELRKFNQINAVIKGVSFSFEDDLVQSIGDVVKHIKKEFLIDGGINNKRANRKMIMKMDYVTV